MLQIAANAIGLIFLEKGGTAIGWEIIVSGLTISWFGMMGLALFDMPHEKASTGDAVSQSRVQLGPSEAARCGSTGDRQATFTSLHSGPYLLLVPFPASPSPKTSPISAESALPRSPVLAFSDTAVGMPQIGPADPPEKGYRSDAGKERDPKTNTFEVRLRQRTDPHFLRLRGQCDDRPIQPFAKMPEIDCGMQVFTTDLIHHSGRNDR